MMSVYKIIGIVLLGSMVLMLVYRYLFHQKFVNEPELGGDFVEKSTVSGGVKRKYSCYYPRGLGDGSCLLFVIHGSEDDGVTFRKRTGYEFDEIADKEKMIVVYPDGYKRSWNDCRKQAKYPSKKKQIDDVAFLKQIVEELSIDREIVIGHVFLFGYSNGGQLVNRICMEDPDWLDAASIMHANLPIAANTDCKAMDVFVPIMVLSGTEDKTNPHKGGMVNVLGIKKLGHVISADESAKYWASLGDDLDYSSHFMVARDASDSLKVEKHEWRDIEGKLQVVQYVVHGGGHTIPNRKMKFPRVLGATSRDFSIYEEAWRFFQGQF